MRAFFLASLLVVTMACGSEGATESQAPGFEESGGNSAVGLGGSSGGKATTAGSSGMDTAGSGGMNPAGSGGSVNPGGANTGGTGTAGTSGDAGAGGSGTAGQSACPVLPTCDGPPPDPGAKRSWNHTLSSATAKLGSPHHRGRDLFLTPGQDQWIIGKFAYGTNDKDIQDEEVDVYLQRNCDAPWEKLVTTKTTKDDSHATVEGVADSGSRVYYKIPQEKALGLGRHRVHMVVAGDLSTTDLILEIVEPGTPFFISDVDGTLTTSENVEFVKLLEGKLPDAHVDAGKALSLLASKGYHPMYVTARPEFLVQRTRDFLKAQGFPVGIVHTTTTLTGALGGSASKYKTDELKMLADRGLVPSWAFGNKASDAEAYNNGKILPIDHRIFYQFDDTVFNGRKINEYTDLLTEFAALPSVCK